MAQRKQSQKFRRRSISVFNTTLAVCTAYLDCCQGRPERVPA